MPIATAPATTKSCIKFKAKNLNNFWSVVLDFFMYAPVTLRQNLRGNKVVWHSNSTREDVLDVLEDPQYQNLVFIGHGDNSTYETTNGTLNVDYLAGLHLPERRGEFIQHTCGSGEGRSLRDVLYPGGSTGYKFNRDVTAAENYGRALVELVM